MSQQSQQTLPTWDLSDLYNGPDDPAIRQDLEDALGRAEDFEQKWRGRINTQTGPAADEFATAVSEFEAIAETLGKTVSYAMLLHAADSSRHEHGALLQFVQDRCTQVRLHLLFFELEWMELADGTADLLLTSAELSRWSHWLRKIRRFRQHRLSEPEERLIDQLANTGSRAWKRFFDDTTAALKFRIKLDGRMQILTESQALSLLHEPDRSVRRAAANAITRTLKAHATSLAYILNTLLYDHEIEDRLRRFDDPMDHRNLENEIDRTTVDALLSACERNYSVVERYYMLKGRLLGIDKLKDYDRYAPVMSDTSRIAFDRCRQVVVDSFRDFSEQCGQIVQEFFERNWIDAEVRPGKMGGAFSAATVPGVHPYILCNFTSKLRDVLTLAHELGHGVHQYLARRAGYLQMSPPLIVSETASVFGEMLTFERLLAEQEDDRTRLALLCSKIEDIFATVFRQVVLTRFEQKLHNARRKEGELPPEKISDIWMEANRPMHGKAVTLTAGYAWWWAYISHFVHVPFYCYAYAFGQLLVLALYGLYRRQGEAFVPRYLELLGKGGSVSPVELLAPMGVDVSQPEFWQQGLDQIADLVTQAEDLAEKTGAKGGLS